MRAYLLRGGASDLGRGAIDFPRDFNQFGVVHDPLKKLSVFAFMLRLASKKEVVQPDRRAAECVRLDDVGAGREVPAMNLVDHHRLGEQQDFQTAFKVFAFPILEAFAAVFALGEFVLLHHRPHGAIEDDDALAHKRFERMESIVRHGEPEVSAVPVHGKEQIDAS